MLSHGAIWDAIDGIAERHGLSPSALARLAGLDATAFNRSKRISKDGRKRWPSTESIAKVLHATGETLDAFLSDVDADAELLPAPRGAAVPLLALTQAGSGSFFDSAGFPAGAGWDEVRLSAIGDHGTFALEVAGDALLPLYRNGDIIVVSPSEHIRRGDRVVVRTAAGEVMVKILHRQTQKNLDLWPVNPEHPHRLIEMRDVTWVSRIVWASQ